MVVHGISELWEWWRRTHDCGRSEHAQRHSKIVARSCEACEMSWNRQTVLDNSKSVGWWTESRPMAVLRAILSRPTFGIRMPWWLSMVMMVSLRQRHYFFESPISMVGLWRVMTVEGKPPKIRCRSIHNHQTWTWVRLKDSRCTLLPLLTSRKCRQNLLRTWAVPNSLPPPIVGWASRRLPEFVLCADLDLLGHLLWSNPGGFITMFRWSTQSTWFDAVCLLDQGERHLTRTQQM